MADVHFALAISEDALKQLRNLPREQRRRIGERLTRLQDLEDLRELNSAIARNKGKKLVNWATAKKELDLED